MAPKKAKNEKEIVFSQTEKAFYELQITDCNQKIARLRECVDDYEVRCEELQKTYDKLDEDKADIIEYLKKVLNVKNEENIELKEKVKGLEELKAIETAEFKQTVNELQHDFTSIKDQLTSLNKILAGKLNTLEEFKVIKDSLMKKFEEQERDFEKQEMKYKRIIYETEKKFIIGKDRLKKEMEERLLQLALDFQDSSELRIAASTQRVIRENIALNNQLDNLVMTQVKVAEENEKFKEDEKIFRCRREAAEEERDKAINKSIIQLKVMDQLTTAFENVKEQKVSYTKKLHDQVQMQTNIQRLQTNNENLLLRVRILEQNLHAILSEQNKSVIETAKLLRESETLKKILKESAAAVHASLKMDKWAAMDPSRELMDMKIMLKKILGVINQYHIAAEAQSTDSLLSLSNIYDKGDLGFDLPIKTPVTAASSDLVFEKKAFEDKHSSFTSVSTSQESLKSAPGIELIAVEEASVPSNKGSLSSFTITSLHSSSSSSAEKEDIPDLSNVSQILALSKLEVQKSLMADLAMSNVPKISQRRFSIEAVSQRASSLGFYDKRTSNDKDQQHITFLIENESEPVQDKGDPTQDIGKHTQDTDEPVAVHQKDDKEDKKKKSSAE